MGGQWDAAGSDLVLHKELGGGEELFHVARVAAKLLCPERLRLREVAVVSDVRVAEAAEEGLEGEARDAVLGPRLVVGRKVSAVEGESGCRGAQRALTSAGRLHGLSIAPHTHLGTCTVDRLAIASADWRACAPVP